MLRHRLLGGGLPTSRELLTEALAAPAAPLPAPPRAFLRTDVEAAIEAALDLAHRLTVLLDAIDGDPALEPEEPKAGAREWCGSGAHRFDAGAAA